MLQKKGGRFLHDDDGDDRRIDQGEERSLLHVLASTRLKLLGDAQEKDEL